MLCLSHYYLCLLFNKIRDKGRTGSALEARPDGGRRREHGAGGRGQGGEMTQTMHAHVNK
jgi:hypothetical protein